MALTNLWDKTKIWSHVWRRANREGRKEEEEEEEEKKRKRRSSKKVWKLNLSMDLWNSKGFVWLIACLQKLGF